MKQISFINVETRLASIMKGMINPFLVVLGLTELPKLGGGGGNPLPPGAYGPAYMWLIMVKVIIVIFVRKKAD